MDSLGDFVKVSDETLDKLEIVRKGIQEVENGVEDDKMKTLLSFLQTRTTFDVNLNKIQLDKKNLIDVLYQFLWEGTTKWNKGDWKAMANYIHISESYFFWESHARLENDFKTSYQTSKARFREVQDTIIQINFCLNYII